MQAIVTKFLPPTNHRGARIVASAQAGRMVLPWRDELDVSENHYQAMRAFVERWAWDEGRAWVTGVLPSGEYCHVAVVDPRMEDEDEEDELTAAEYLAARPPITY